MFFALFGQYITPTKILNIKVLHIRALSYTEKIKAQRNNQENSVISLYIQQGKCEEIS